MLRSQLTLQLKQALQQKLAKELEDFYNIIKYESEKRLAEVEKQMRHDSLLTKNLTADFSKLKDDHARTKKQVSNLISISDDQQELIEGLNEFSLEVKQYIDQKRESGIHSSSAKKPMRQPVVMPMPIERASPLGKGAEDT
jgi:hypothetical protein